MNNKYFTVISRDEFLKLYSFGSLNISFSYIVNNNEFSNKKIENILKNLPFEYEEGYLVLEFEDEKIEINHKFGKISILYKLYIKTIKTVYTLSKMAQNFYSTKFNPKIKFPILPFTDVLNNVQKDKEYEDMEKGVDVLFEQFVIPNKEGIEKDFGVDFKAKLLDCLGLDNYLDQNYNNYYFDLVSYKRENKFTKKDVDFIYDIMIITILKDRDNDKNSKFKQGELKLDKSPTYKILEENSKENLFEYIEFIKDSEDESVIKFIAKSDMQNIIIGSIFLKIKSILDEEQGKKEGYQEELKKLIASFRVEHEKELGIALYLVGLIFGYKKLYDDYYDYLDLEIFKDSITTDKVINESKIQDISIDELVSRIKKLEHENETLNKKLERSDNQKMYSIEDDQREYIDINSTTKNLEEEQKAEKASITVCDRELKNDNLENFLHCLEVTSLSEIYFRTYKEKNEQLNQIRANYNKQQLIDKILSLHANPPNNPNRMQ